MSASRKGKKFALKAFFPGKKQPSWHWDNICYELWTLFYEPGPGREGFGSSIWKVNLDAGCTVTDVQTWRACINIHSDMYMWWHRGSGGRALGIGTIWSYQSTENSVYAWWIRLAQRAWIINHNHKRNHQSFTNPQCPYNVVFVFKTRSRGRL